VLDEDVHQLHRGALGAVEEGQRAAVGDVLADGGADVLDELHEAADDIEIDGALLVEVQVEGALGDAGGAGDVVDGGVVVALGGEELASRGDEVGAPAVSRRPWRSELAVHRRILVGAPARGQGAIDRVAAGG
jgi:hypothetical protein